MGGRGRLAAGRPRRFGREDAVTSWVARQTWATLCAEYDLSRPLARDLAGLVMVAAVNLDASTKALATARRTRAEGAGRRPSSRDIERLARRQGIDTVAYAAALDRLRDCVQANGHDQDLAQLLAREARRGER
jgi:hypothetical protein